jgi:hypothetical protein
LPTGRGKNCVFAPHLCISEVFRKLVGAEIKHFFIPQSDLSTDAVQQSTVALRACLKAKVFAGATVLSDKNNCLKIVQCNIDLSQNINIMAKLRFTKYFSFLSTVYVDNFVDKEEISLLIPRNKVYCISNVVKFRSNKIFNNQ